MAKLMLRSSSFLLSSLMWLLLFDLILFDICHRSPFRRNLLVSAHREADNIAGESDDFEFFHVLPNNPLQKLSAGWQEVGLVRPKFMIQRKFFANPAANKPAFSDRIRIRFCEDRSVCLYGKHRPWISLHPFSDPKYLSMLRTSALALANEDVGKDVAGRAPVTEIQDGAWNFKNGFNARQPDIEFDVNSHTTKRREHHFSTLNWGQIDEVAANIAPGRIFTYKYTKRGQRCIM
jgi:hypothetical protein